MGKHKKLHNTRYKSLIYIVLDSFVEAVHLVNEQDGMAAAGSRHLGALDCLADVLDPGKHRRQRGEFGIKGMGQDARQRGLAHAGRPPEDH